MTKLKEQNLNPHRPVSKSRGAVFSIYEEPFPPKQSMNSTQSKIDAKCCHLLVERISCRVSSSYKQQSKLILIIRNCNGFLNTLATRLLSPSQSTHQKVSLFVFFWKVAQLVLLLLQQFFGILYFFCKATFLLTSTKDCQKLRVECNEVIKGMLGAMCM